MLKKTHTAIGIASALAIMQPKSYTGILTTVVAGAIGAQLPDIDSTTSDSHRDADLICLSSVLFLCGAALCDQHWNMGLVNKIINNSSYVRILLGVFGLIGLCAYGKETSHRTFMHSLLSALGTTLAVWIAIPFAAPSFFIGYISHILIDLLNKRKVQILFPYKKGVCLNLCRSNGTVNSLLGSVGSALIVIEICILLSGKL